MTKSRTALILSAQLAATWPAEAAAQDAPLAPEERIAAYNDRIRAAMGAISGARFCRRDASRDDDIIVCGRDEAARQRLPLGSQPVEGQRHRLIAGEVPSATGALDVGRACCAGGGLDVLGILGALGRGAERILHPD